MKNTLNNVADKVGAAKSQPAWMNKGVGAPKSSQPSGGYNPTPSPAPQPSAPVVEPPGDDIPF